MFAYRPHCRRLVLSDRTLLLLHLTSLSIIMCAGMLQASHQTCFILAKNLLTCLPFEMHEMHVSQPCWHAGHALLSLIWTPILAYAVFLQASHQTCYMLPGSSLSRLPSKRSVGPSYCRGMTWWVWLQRDRAKLWPLGCPPCSISKHRRKLVLRQVGPA